MNSPTYSAINHVGLCKTEPETSAGVVNYEYCYCDDDGYYMMIASCLRNISACLRHRYMLIECLDQKHQGSGSRDKNLGTCCLSIQYSDVAMRRRRVASAEVDNKSKSQDQQDKS